MSDDKTTFEKLRPWILGLLGVAILVGFGYFLTTLGPGSMDSVRQIRASDDPEAKRLSVEVDDLEAVYNKGVEAGLVTKEALDALREAIEKQRYLLANFSGLSGDQLIRLGRLEKAYDTEEGKRINVDIGRLKDNAEQLISQGKREEALKMLQEALKMQRSINQSNADPRMKSFSMETILSRQVTVLEAEPIWKEKEEAVAAARIAVAEKRWSDALSAYQAAYNSQQKLNREYTGTGYSSILELDQLRMEIASLDAAPQADAILAKEREADATLTVGDTVKAAELFAEVRQLQLQLNQTYPKSRFVSSERIDEFERKEQTALSSHLVDELMLKNKELTGLLKQGQLTGFEAKLAESQSLISKLFAEYPKSQRLDPVMRMKFAYLGVKRADIGKIQAEINAALQPVPGEQGVFMMKTEVGQLLFNSIMNVNPSRNPGRTLPVDSITWNQAQEFCMRISWIMGVPVRMPTEAEFRLALSMENPGSIISSEISKGRPAAVSSGEPNEKGFHDLLGNLSEWLHAGASADRAPIIGGSYADTLEEIKKVPVGSSPKRERSRTVGFRIVIEKGNP